MKNRLSLICISIGLATWGLLMPATAHEQAVADADDSSGRLDVAEVDVSHDDRVLETGVVRFVLTFFEPHGFSELAGGYIRMDFDLFRGGKRDRYLMVLANPDGGMYGELFSGSGGVIGYSRAWAPSEDQIAIELRMRQLSAGELPSRINWHASTGYEDESCGEGGDVDGACVDSTPEYPERFHRHRLSQ